MTFESPFMARSPNVVSDDAWLGLFAVASAVPKH
jgi:hypothetical protein